MPKYTSNDMKRFAAYIKKEAKNNLSKHISSDENFFLGITYGRYSIEIYGKSNYSVLTQYMEELKTKAKTLKNSDEICCYERAQSALKEWAKLGYVPNEYRVRYSTFRLSEIVPTDSTYQVSCLATTESVLRLANKIKNNAGKPCKSGLSHSEYAKNTSQTGCYVWQVGKEWRIAKYVSDDPYHKDFVVTVRDGNYRVVHKTLALCLGNECRGSKNEALEVARKALARLNAEEYQELVSNFMLHNPNLTHQALLATLSKSSQLSFKPDEDKALAIQSCLFRKRFNSVNALHVGKQSY